MYEFYVLKMSSGIIVYTTALLYLYSISVFNCTYSCIIIQTAIRFKWWTIIEHNCSKEFVHYLWDSAKEGNSALIGL